MTTNEESEHENPHVIKSDSSVSIDTDGIHNIVNAAVTISLTCNCGNDIQIYTVQSHVRCQNCGDGWRLEHGRHW